MINNAYAIRLSSSVLPRALEFRPSFFVCRAQRGRQCLPEISRLEHRPRLDHPFAGSRVRTAFEPLDRFLHGLYLPQPEAGDQLLGLRERTVRDSALRTLIK